MRGMTRVFLISLLCSATPLFAADLVVAPLFRDGAVLQRGRDVPVWGKAGADAEVVVSFGDHRAVATADGDGRWEAALPAMDAEAEPRVMTVTSGEDTLEVADVLVGEVWLASGQSNMGWQIRQSREEDQEMAAERPVPGLRVFTVPQRLNHERQFTVDGEWTHATPETAPRLTAVGYFFGRKLVEELGVPVGIVNSSWGGSTIAPWIDDETGFDGVGELAEVRAHRRLRSPGMPEFRRLLRAYAVEMQEWSEKAVRMLDAGGDPTGMPEAPELLSLGHRAEAGTYQAMIHPLAPYALRGTIWYQGESNRGDGMEYFHMKRALIQGWRDRFRAPEMPFLFVQIAPYRYGNDRPDELAEFWAVQQRTLEIPHTGMVVTLDIGDLDDIHPGNKSEVGRRLALWALADSYGRDGLVKSGPLFRGYRVVDGGVEIEFDHVGGGLATRDGEPPSHFEVAGEDGEFKPAVAAIAADGTSLVVSSEAVAEPVRARFAWEKTAEPNLMNREGLPAGAFDTGWGE